MSNNSKFQIELDQKFPRLSKAPITECVVEVRARATTDWKEDIITEPLKQKLPEYPSFKPETEFKAELTIKENTKADHSIKNMGLKGLVFNSGDKLQLARFHRDLFSFNRLKPYCDWERFSSEAIRLWNIHNDLAKPVEVQRVGLRFINQIEVSNDSFELEDYLKVSPKEPDGLDLPFANFYHKDSFLVSGYNYIINIIKTLKPSADPTDISKYIIIDIDVFTYKPIDINNICFENCLDEMRWLKNKAFFGTITEKTKEILL